MTTIYIDTNIIFSESFFRSPWVSSFLKACNILQISVVIPEVVLDEGCQLAAVVWDVAELVLRGQVLYPSPDQRVILVQTLTSPPFPPPPPLSQLLVPPAVHGPAVHHQHPGPGQAQEGRLDVQ